MIFFFDQIKLQQQKLHLGPPPLLLLPIKRREDLDVGSSEEDSLPRSPSEVSHEEGLYMSISNKVLQLQQHSSIFVVTVYLMYVFVLNECFLHSFGLSDCH